MAQSLALFKDCTYDISVIVFDMVNSRRNRNIFETHLCLGSLEVDGLLHTCPRHGSRVARVLTFACHPTNICGCLPVFVGLFQISSYHPCPFRSCAIQRYAIGGVTAGVPLNHLVSELGSA